MAIFSEEVTREFAKAVAAEVAALLQKTDRRPPGAPKAEPDWPEVMDLKWVAKFFGTTVKAAAHQMRNLEIAGEINPCKIDGKKRWRRVDIERLVERRS